MTHRGKDQEGNLRGGRKEGERAQGPIEARLGGLPLSMELTTVRGPVRIELDDPKDKEIKEADFRVDGEEWIGLRRSGSVWEGYLHTEGLSDGEYEIELRARRKDGNEERVAGTFRVRNRAR
jgi:hypothetical protein